MKKMKKDEKNQDLISFAERAIPRRRFLSAIAGTAAFTIVPRHVLGGPGHVAPSEMLRLAGIGVGGQGRSDLSNMYFEDDDVTPRKDVRIVALCDVDSARAEDTFKLFHDVPKFQDYREMFAKMEDAIDAVVVATPDHTHAPASMLALKKRKHVYCEKPLTHTIQEARALTLAAREAGVMTQMGNQGQASEKTRRICEIIWDGAIGPVHEVHVWTNRPVGFWQQGIERPTEQVPVPDTLNWDLWLGTAPQRPYHPSYLPVAWRGWWDFGTGALGDMGCHNIDSTFRALKLHAPISVYASSTPANNETYPLGSIIHYEFPARKDMPPVKMTWYDGGLKPPRPDEMEPVRQLDDNGVIFIGEKGTMIEATIIPETKRKAYTPPPKTLPRSVGHSREWVQSCLGDKPGGSNFSFSGPLTETVLLGNIALRPELRDFNRKNKLLWDYETMTFTNCPEANQYVTQTYREGWSF